MTRRLLAPLALLGLAACSHTPDAAPAEEHGTPPAVEPRTARGALLEVEADEQEAEELAFATPEPWTFRPSATCYGRVIRDPGRRFELRAPCAGTLLAGDVEAQLGATLEDGARCLRIAPRWTPQERADLAARRLAAHAELEVAEAELPTLEAELARDEALNAQDRAVADREVEAARGRLRVARARVASARALASELDALEPDAAAAALPLTLARGGIVTDVPSAVGGQVEAGALLLVVEDLGAPLVSVDLPLDGSVSPEVAVARVVVLDREVEAERVALAPDAGGTGLAPGVLFRVRGDAEDARLLRPGLAVVARLETDAPPSAGARLPSSAVLLHTGRRFAWVRRGATEFERVPIEPARRVDGGWFVDAGWGRGADGAAPEVVVRGAAALLTLELLGRQGEDEE